MTSKLAIVVLAAGQGTRMKSALPKVLHKLGGRPMLAHVLDAARKLQAARIIVVRSADADEVVDVARAWDAATVVQERQLGTGHAVLASEGKLEDFDGDLLVLFGDSPLLTVKTLGRLLDRLKSADMAALGFRAADPTGYGRMIVDGDIVKRIVEEKDATPAERRVDLCFAGMLAARGHKLFEILRKVGNKNAQGEFYLTDAIALGRKAGLTCAVVEGSEAEMLGVNSRAQLAAAEAAFQARKRAELMEAGVSFAAPETVYLSADTVIEADAVIGPYVVIGPGVTIRKGAEIRAFSHLEGAEVGPNAIVGPFARLRPGTVLEKDVHVGNYVEVKNARLEEGAKANHLTYIGDARVGAKTNIGAGTITCNYDGAEKHVTDIGANAFVGSNTTLVAPVKVGDGAYVAAGSTITENVEKDALALGRARQVAKPERAKAMRAKRQPNEDEDE
ncbi:MAG TPA: bifunctional UDP-N-acetylglucosamine diphosphorylase/glucosamine-1-phosphate N-acetyltransferase GlmU [Micropepsaceae bacterium]|nr:bifunctional UDP-N-acetylglucosamine diphosphorylase/glucosamine-1-phosphate N-acetyltransferase GlmU [Micropepsaceae bacterium]